MMDNDTLAFATVRELEIIEAIEREGTQAKAAKALGINERSIRRALERLKMRAARRGVAPEHDFRHGVPEGFIAKGVSTLYSADGKVSAQWVKASLEDTRAEEARQAALEAMLEEIKPVKPQAFKGHTNDKLLALYTLTDSHVGMLAWHKEGGEDWDLDIAERTLVGCFEQMVAAAPNSRVGIVNQLGDFLHQDGLAAVTPTSGHNLDSDGRFAKIIEVAVRILRRVVSLALAKHERVILMLHEGNHDIVSSLWLKAMFKALYEAEPRVEVVTNILPYHVIAHGATLLGFHHGHLKKNDQLPMLIAAQFPQAWGQTRHRYVHTGHRHHTEIKEHTGITVEQHPTLAARDAYAARGGWIAERKVSAIVYHDEHGEVGRVVVTPEMLAA